MSRIYDWERKHWRNRAKALSEKEEPTATNPWYVLKRWENQRGDSVSLGYADDDLRGYAVALNGNVVELTQTRKAANEVAKSLMQKLIPADLQDDETNRNVLLSYAAAHGVEGVTEMDKAELRQQIRSIEREQVYELEDAIEQE